MTDSLQHTHKTLVIIRISNKLLLVSLVTEYERLSTCWGHYFVPTMVPYTECYRFVVVTFLSPDNDKEQLAILVSHDSATTSNISETKASALNSSKAMYPQPTFKSLSLLPTWEGHTGSLTWFPWTLRGSRWGQIVNPSPHNEMFADKLQHWELCSLLSVLFNVEVKETRSMLLSIHLYPMIIFLIWLISNHAYMQSLLFC